MQYVCDKSVPRGTFGEQIFNSETVEILIARAGKAKAIPYCLMFLRSEIGGLCPRLISY
jgi:hypothetical protein